MVTLTKEQRKAVYRKYLHNPDGAQSYREFRNRIEPGWGYVGLQWCGMFLGIERDGHTHS
jgi:hypothetical protein